MTRKQLNGSTSRRRAVLARGFFILLAIAGCYGLGIATAKRQWPPYRQLRQLYRTFAKPNEQLVSRATSVVSEETHLVRSAFSDPLAMGVQQLFPKCLTIEEVHAQLRSLEIDPALYYTAYADLKTTLTTMTQSRFDVEYALDGPRHAHAYYSKTTQGTRDCAALIIPGTGLNQSTSIVMRDPDNYHGGIHELVTQHCDTFVLVKPNEDFLAIHDGQQKLGPNFVYAHLLNRGSSYSANYLTHALAISKALKSRYPRVLVLGLSQGGLAAMHVSLQARPDGALIASGFSIVNYRFLCANIEQIIIPAVNRKLTFLQLRQQLATRSPYFMFTYGIKETGIYGYEAATGTTANALVGMPNIEVVVHSGGHVFDPESVRRFFRRVSRTNQSNNPPALHLGDTKKTPNAATDPPPPVAAGQN